MKCCFSFLRLLITIGSLFLLMPGASPAAEDAARETQSAAFFYKSAQLSIKKQNYAEALETIEKGLRLAPAYLPFLWQKSLVLTRLGRHEEASKLIDLAISTMPDNLELNLLAVENIVAVQKNPESRDAMLIARFKKASGKVLPFLTAELVESYSGADGRGQAALKALASAGVLDDPDQRVLEACLGDNPELAATLLKTASQGLEKQKPRARTVAALSFLAAQALQKRKKYDQANVMYDQALTLGYDREKLIESWAGIYAADGRDPVLAAKLYESFWRDSTRPHIWAVKAAEARQTAGQNDKALDILKKALAILPHDPLLEGRYYYHLSLSGHKAELLAYAEDLQKRKESVGLAYGQYLAASAQKGGEAANEARQTLLEAVRNTTTVHPRDSIRYIVEGLNLTTKVPDMSRQADLLRDSGWKLWDEGKGQEAFKYWKDAVLIDPDRNRTANAGICMTLMQSGMISQAIELFRLQFPDVPEFAIGLMLMRAGQWHVAWPVLSEMKAGGDMAVWRALGLAYSALKSDVPPDAARAAARNFLSMSPPAGDISCRVPDRDSGIGLLVLDRKYYFSLVKEYFQEILKQGYADLLDPIMASAQFRLIPPRDRAVMLVDAAFDLTSKEDAAGAAPLWRAAIKLAPGLPEANLGMALIEKMAGNKAASDNYLRLGAGSGALKKEYIMGQMCLLDGDVKGAAEHFERYLKVEKNNFSAGYQLFNLFLVMKEYDKARAIRAYFSKNSGNPEVLLYLALCNQGLGYYKNAERIFRDILKKRPGHAPAIRGLVAVLRAQDRFSEAERLLADAKMEDPEVLTVLRHKAEKAQRGRNPEQAEGYALRYLEKDPDSIQMNDVYNSSLREQYRMEKAEIEKLKRDKIKLEKGRLDENSVDPERLAELKRLSRRDIEKMKPDDGKLAQAEEHAGFLLARNKVQYNALESILDTALQREQFKKAAYLSRDMASTFAYDPNLALQSGIHMGAIGRFDYSLPLTEKMAARGANAAAEVICFANISSLAREDAYTARDIENHLEYFKRAYKIVSLNEALAVPEARADKDFARLVPMLVIIGRASPAQLLDIDAVLLRQGARAALMVGEESFISGTPAQWPDSAFLRKLAATGRWEFILTDMLSPSIVKDASGRKGRFWGEAAWLGDRRESKEEMETRWSTAIARIKAEALRHGISPQAWMYPGGDFGQLGLDADDEVRQAYAEAVKANFLTAFVPTGSGYHLDNSDPLHVPARNLYYPLDEKALMAMPQAHPSRLAVLDEAMLTSWHGQFPSAERLFAKSSDLGLSPRDISYYRASNALFAEDAAYANQLAREAREIDPEDPRTEILLERAERLKRPRIAFTPRWWQDDAERNYSEYTLSFSGHVTDQLALSATASEIIWGYDGKYTEGQALGAGLRYYPFKEHWLDLAIRGVIPNDSDGFAEWLAAWRGVYATDFLNINGIYNLVYQRQGIETRESIREGIYADRFAFNTSMRILNWGELNGEIYHVSRTDGNKTWGLTLNPGYILWDKPHLKLGYLFNTANSDKNPPEYYAPQDYVSHMAVLSGYHEIFKGFTLRGMLGGGMAISRNKDWREVFRVQLGFDWAITDDFSLQGGYQRLEMPDYKLDQFTLGVQYVF